MHYLVLGWRLRETTIRHGVPLVSDTPIEEIRAWAWENNIRYVLRAVTWESEEGEGFLSSQFLSSQWIGFYSAGDAFAFKMRWG